MVNASIDEASIDKSGGLLRDIVADALSQLRRLFSEELGCEHNELVFDDINDVSCKHCGQDFTG